MNKTNPDQQARLFWNMDLDEFELSMGVNPDLLRKQKVVNVDERIPPQGTVLLDRLSFLDEPCS